MQVGLTKEADAGQFMGSYGVIQRRGSDLWVT